jgi:hypothetical protein
VKRAGRFEVESGQGAFGAGSGEGSVAPTGLGGLGLGSQRLRAGLTSAAPPALGLGCG